jgi:protoporphyrinogen oxidase
MESSNRNRQSKPRTALIIGAGPAGLTAAYELLQRSAVVPIILEKSEHLGGISRTVVYKGNRMDIGGHRFFSKSDRVMNWWLNLMPVESEDEHQVTYRKKHRTVQNPVQAGPRDGDRVMLVRPRKSRIFFLRNFFEYPIKLTADTLTKLGLLRTILIGLSYVWAMLRPIKPEKNLEEFLINRFGRQLYLTFFKSYTEKVWGVPCHQISSEWGAQRIKGLSITTALAHFAKKAFGSKSDGVEQKQTETSLIERFLYPKLGPGQLWEHVAEKVQAEGGVILHNWSVDQIHREDQRIVAVTARHTSGEVRRFEADYFLSTMPVKELVAAMDGGVPANVKEVASNLIYRDFITVGLLVDKLLVSDEDSMGSKLLKDNWIYIQEPDVLVGRLQIFNNWSPFMVADPTKIWLGLEYFCYETDELWKKSDEEMKALAVAELEKMGMVAASDVLDGTVVRVPKTYPAYFGIYDRFNEVREYVDRFENLFLVGRNGMHKYNNQDHSMLTAMTAVDNILEERTDKTNIWSVNTEGEYHEEKSPARGPQPTAAVARA